MIDIKTRLILKKEDKILLSLQRTTGSGKYTLVGGRVEQMEFAKEALVRECYEELNIRLKKGDLELVHMLHKKNKKGNVVTFYFTTTQWQGKVSNKEPQNFSSIEWHPINNLPTRTSPTTMHVITKVLNGKIYSELNRERK